MATLEDSIDFADVSFTKNELGLGLGQEIHEIREYKNGLGVSRLFSDIKYYEIIGITKGFTSEGEAPALQLSFTIIGVPKEEVFGEDINDDERVQIGMSILRLRKRKRIKDMQLGSLGNMALHCLKNSNDYENWLIFLKLYPSCSNQFNSLLPATKACHLG